MSQHDRPFTIMFDYDKRKRSDCPASVPWGLVAPHERQAVSNHSQSLQRLNERGGLSPSELYCTLRDESLDPIRYNTITEAQAVEYIKTQLEAYNAITAEQAKDERKEKF